MAATLHHEREKTNEIIKHVIITVFSLLIVRYLNDLLSISLASCTPKTDRNKIIFDVFVAILLFLMVVLLSIIL